MNGGGGGLILQHVPSRYQISFQSHKDEVLRRKLILAHDPTQNICKCRRISKNKDFSKY